MCVQIWWTRGGSYLHGGDVVAVGGHLEGDHGGGGAPVHQALVQHVVHRLPLPAPADQDMAFTLKSVCIEHDAIHLHSPRT